MTFNELSFCERLEILVIRSGLSKWRIAGSAEIDPTRFSKFLHGSYEPKPAERKRLAKAFKCDEVDLIPKESPCPTDT